MLVRVSIKVQLSATLRRRRRDEEHATVCTLHLFADVSRSARAVKWMAARDRVHPHRPCGARVRDAKAGFAQSLQIIGFGTVQSDEKGLSMVDWS